MPIRRLTRPACERMVTEDVPWARPASTFTRPFVDAVALLAEMLSKSALTEMMRISWATVGSIADRVAAEKLAANGLDGLRRIGINEVSYRGNHRYLTVIVDHDSGHIAWVGQGKCSATLADFFEELGLEPSRSWSW